MSDTLPVSPGLDWAENSADCSIAAGVLSCDFGDLASNASASVHLSSPTAKEDCGLISNTATVSTSNDGSDSSTADVTVNCGEIEIDKTADADTVSAGDAIGFAITVTNTGAGIARDVMVSDTLPVSPGLVWSEDSPECSIAAGVLSCDFGDMGSNASASVHLSSPTAKEDCGVIENTATVATSNDGEGSSSADVTVNCGDIKIEKTADEDTVSAGDEIGFAITVTNDGAGIARDVMVSDTLPVSLGLVWSEDSPECSIAAGVLSCDFGDLAPNGSASVHLSSPTAKEDCGVIENTATVATSNDGEGSSSADVTVNCGDIKIEKTADEDTVSAGDEIGFAITVTNDGAGIARDVMVSDTLPVSLGLVWSEDSPECSIAAGVLSCDFGDLAPNGSASVHLSSPTAKEDCGDIDNSATVSTSNAGSASSSADVTLNCGDIQI